LSSSQGKEANVLDHVDPIVIFLYTHLHAINLNPMLHTFSYHSLSP
jgi:hypothetical protein